METIDEIRTVVHSLSQSVITPLVEQYCNDNSTIRRLYKASEKMREKKAEVDAMESPSADHPSVRELWQYHDFFDEMIKFTNSTNNHELVLEHFKGELDRRGY